jgi:hypothetical protein
MKFIIMRVKRLVLIAIWLLPPKSSVQIAAAFARASVSTFQRSPTIQGNRARSFQLLAAQGIKNDETKPSPPPEPILSTREEQVKALLQELGGSELPFRIVVVGNGAILESTNLLGPSMMKVSRSPSTDANLVTFASDDASFEFHLMVGQVGRVVMVEKQSPLTGKAMRIIRFLTDGGDEPAKSICSLILAEDSDASGVWYQNLYAKYGPEWQLGD